MDDDDWCLTAEQFDYLEKDAYQKIASQRMSSSRPPLPPIPPPSTNKGVQIDNTQTANVVEQQQQKQQPKWLVKFVLHSSGLIAAKFQYHHLVVEAFKKIQKASWNAKERLWMFPISSLSVIEGILNGIHGVNIQVQQLNNIVQCALHASLACPDLQGLYAQMPSCIESTLLPFQRDGVRFILQHGGRAILADEMGLGKTLQAIAFASCVMDHWPVLILTPPSLRLDWASAIHQWLDITPSNILVVLSQNGGSNKKGFNIVNSSFRETIQLDGVFNILSYDAIPKLQDLILASKFEVVIADESHYLKNAQAKRTSACLPILQKARHTILLSGTPALSRPIELFKQLAALYPTVYKNVHDYGNRYCKSAVFGKYQGSINHDELHNLMKTTVMIRRLKKDVLTELPEKRRQKVSLNVNEKDLKEVKILFRELEDIRNQISTCESSEILDSLVLLQKNTINKV
ncbi:hypothetical protein ZOSMA_137G00360 [Zostera marina]|uniref:SWI/SNF-related matrix-associated actin-dependent regulator of chromatin subfamily A-like protein 1 n=1 Tax=Zostera marina TaxID=29655 RepID=A0A0K9PYK3_ZOSMR|nr:hypothetical protein ZOSMA_137G00360 [Zostera marina]